MKRSASRGGKRNMVYVVSPTRVRRSEERGSKRLSVIHVFLCRYGGNTGLISRKSRIES